MPLSPSLVLRSILYTTELILAVRLHLSVVSIDLRIKSTLLRQFHIFLWDLSRLVFILSVDHSSLMVHVPGNSETVIH